MAAALDRITDFPALVEYLRDELEWPIPEDISLDEATYDVTPEEIGLKAEAIGGGIEIKQLRPLNRAQPWGVFFLNLPNAKLPVTLVRNILGKLAVKKRASANKAQQAAFAKHDLLFIAATGAASERRLAFAHFADDEIKGDAAILKVLGWDANDTPRRLGLTEASLKTKLHWPDDPTDADHWRKQWGEAFAHSDTRTVVRDSKAMAVALAALARRIRERAKQLIAAQTDTGSLVQLHKAFKEALIHDLTPEGFADTYAQTIAYGLLSAAISRSSGALVQENVTDVVHPTSPFLKEMLGAFIEAGGRRPGKANADLDFDELGITEVVELLRKADMEAVLADFDRKNPDEDPVIHFYELFLKEYDAEQKVKRGVFYTPRPVVGFIVRSVDEVLRTEFGLEDGLASTATWGEVIAASKGKEGAEIKLPEGAKASDPFVRILDPATGTGTFLVECVDQIYKTMVNKWFRQGLSKGPRDPRTVALWNEYVPRHLLPRLTGFELMMAPYAIAHVKFGLKLADTGYQFGTDGRAQIYLTNALEAARDVQLDLDLGALAEESRAANDAKETRFTVVIGNPPYANYSANLGRAARRLVDRYRKFRGEQIRERNQLQFERNIQDDYVKFFSISQSIIDSTGVGILSYITNATALSSRSLRGFRQNICESFDNIYELNLHGGTNEILDGEIEDKNVFDISQAVAIHVYYKTAIHEVRPVHYCDLWGPREQKYEALQRNSLTGLAWNDINLDFENMTFSVTGRGVQRGFLRINDIFSQFGAGIKTNRDEVVIDFDKQSLSRKVIEFNKNFASVPLADMPIVDLRYRPFDVRKIFFHRDLIKSRSWPTMQHVIGHKNIGLIASSSWTTPDKFSVSVSEEPVEMKTGTHDRGTTFFPAYRFERMLNGKFERVSNLQKDFIDEWTLSSGTIEPDDSDAQRELQTLLPENIVNWMLFLSHSPEYRKRYLSPLSTGFPIVLFPATKSLLNEGVKFGSRLTALYLLKADEAVELRDPQGIRLAGSGETRVAHRPEYDSRLGRVMINDTRWFETVPQVAWDFYVGGYQPAQKWLKDRAAKGGKKKSDGRVLTDDDILHYRRMIAALTRTAELMPKIDEVIEKHGGWPDAFRGLTDAPASTDGE